MLLEGKIAVITGAGQGIGKAICLAFAKEGADIATNDINLADALATASEVKSLGRRAMAIGADVSNQGEVSRMVEQVIREWGGVDILVNNARFGIARLVEDISDSEWLQVLGVNLDGPFYCSKAVIETMKNRGGGKIINVVSPAAKTMTSSACAAFTSSQAGVLGFTRHLAFEVGPYKINVNAICGSAPVEERVLLKDVIRFEDITNAALFLVSNSSRLITGSVIDIDGGSSVSCQDWDTFVRVRKEAFTNQEPAHKTEGP
jgi:NAD(P)-dependent dehydrogenase (short-subunit alcohol dehydrogenase family)